MLEHDESISVVIPTYNRGTIIDRAIRSALRQTLRPTEVLIVDDCSADDTCAIVEAMAIRDRRIKLIRMERNKGGAAARNRGIAVARGEFVAFLDSDDEWMEQHLDRKIGLLRENPQAGLAFGSFYMLSGQRKTLQFCFPLDRDPLEYLFLGRGDMRTSTFVGRREHLMEVQFDSGLMKHQDWDLFIKFARRFGVVADARPTAALHVSSSDRLSGKLNQEATRRFCLKNRNYVSTDGWILFATVVLSWTFQAEGRSSSYCYYIEMVKRLDRRAYTFVNVLSTLLYVPHVGGRLFRAACRIYILATARSRRAGIH